MRSMVEGPLLTPKNPSTPLRAVPLPRKCGGGLYGQRPSKFACCFWRNAITAPLKS